MSKSHEEFLEFCWPKYLAKLPLFQYADFCFFSAEWFDLSRFPSFRKDSSLRLYDNTGYQDGAMLAMKRATRRGWFKNYDWIVRVNPDVLIRNDTWLLETMADDSIDAILVNCGQLQGIAINTDFFAYRPKAMPNNAWEEMIHDNNEQTAGKYFKSIVEGKRVAWLPDVDDLAILENRLKTGCRVHGEESPVIHDHSVLEQCKEE
eukprot:CAMPEP_0195526184 /NCGR_PEP_ID=MMETSP0794_2-20130614/27098_1 /TAXON_ID=515487 /ORGANISM="Stephanopyxis turris, Strain CCMP 815" /LENGTH=204 /DNA_ID=CAMNT_0040656809 /DNA_START=201 /DNA_END=815 /DNA_ORIENTATION=+